MRPETSLTPVDMRRGSSRVCIQKGAAVKRTLPVDYRYFVSGAVPQHPHAVPRLLGVEQQRIALNLITIE